MSEMSLENLSKEEFEKLFSKKQLTPIISAFHIAPNRNSKFKQIITLFPNQTNYQIWAVKSVWNRNADMNTIIYIKEWAEKNHQLIQKLEKKNIVSYNTYDDFIRLKSEIKSINRYMIVKRNIDKFNTEQRAILNDYLYMKSCNYWNFLNDSRCINIYQKFEQFEKLSLKRQNNFLIKASAIRNIDELILQLNRCIEETWEWNKDDLKECILGQTKDSKIVFENDTTILAQINSYESAKKICGGGRTRWCITTQTDQWDSYVEKHKDTRKQFFLFDFAKNEKNDNTAMIAFTTSKGEGIIFAHTIDDRAITENDGYSYDGNIISIYNVINKLNIPYKSFLSIGKLNYNWDKESVKKVISDLKSSIVYQDNNKLILSIKSENDFKLLCENTYLENKNAFNFNDVNFKNYLLFDFSKEILDNMSLIGISTKMDEYMTEAINSLHNIFGVKLDNKYLDEIGIKEDDFLKTTIDNKSLLLHKYLDEGNKEKVNELINDDNVDINYEFNDRLPIFIATQNGLFEEALKMINNPKFDFSKKDGYGELIFTDLIFTYIYSDGDDEINLEKLLKNIVNQNSLDFSLTTDNNDTALTTALSGNINKTRTNWLIKEILKKDNININMVNGNGDDALALALKNKNNEVINLLLERKDINVTDNNRELAKSLNIDIDKVNVNKKNEVIKKIVTAQNFSKKKHFNKLTVNEVIDTFFF